MIFLYGFNSRSNPNTQFGCSDRSLSQEGPEIAGQPSGFEFTYIRKAFRKMRNRRGRDSNPRYRFR